MVIQWIYKNHLAELDHLAKDLECLGSEQKIDNATLYAIHLCLDEIITNIIQHAYKNDGEQHSIMVRVEKMENKIDIGIIDEGTPFNPLDQICNSAMLNKPIEERPIGGLGIHLVRNMMDHVQYQRQEGKNILLLSKLLKK